MCTYLRLVSLFSLLFSWKNKNGVADRMWQRVYDLVGSYKGVEWVAKRTVGNLNSYLMSISSLKTDTLDLGQVRFSVLMRIFSLEVLQVQMMNV